MKKIIISILMVLILICIAILHTKLLGKKNQTFSSMMEIKTNKLKQQSPKLKLKSAIEKRDLCFLGVNEYSMIVPLVEEFYRSFPKATCVHVMENTSDVIENDAQESYQLAAKEYAGAYNQLLLEYLEKNLSKEKYDRWIETKNKIQTQYKYNKSRKLHEDVKNRKLDVSLN